MIWLIIFLLLVTWLPCWTEANELRSRSVVSVVLVGILMAVLMKNPWLTAFAILWVTGVYWRPHPSSPQYLHFTLRPALLWAVPYVLLAPLVTKAWVIPILQTFVGIAGIAVLWLIHSLFQERPYDLHRGMLRLYEPKSTFVLGQGNAAHASLLLALGMAACFGLAILQSLWWFPVSMIFTLALLTVWWNPNTQGLPHGIIAQALILLAVVTITEAVLRKEFAVLFVWLILPIFALVATRSRNWSSDRTKYAAFAWSLWKESPWYQKLLGRGPQAWSTEVARRRPFGPDISTSPHNEWIHIAVEQGIIGLLLIVGYLITTALALYAVGPEGHAVLLLGSAVLVSMTVSFPATLYHEFLVSSLPDGIPVVRFLGSPAMNAWILAVVILGEIR